MYKEEIHAREQNVVLNCFPEEGNLAAHQVISILRQNQENEIFTALPYQVRYILGYLEMKGDLKFDQWTGTYGKA